MADELSSVRRENMKPKSLSFGDLTLHGANADLFEVAQEHANLWTACSLSEVATALGARQDNFRVAASKRVINALWSRFPELGPYPFLDSLSEFEFERTFYPLYRDHVCHQLKVFLLGLGVYHGCPRLHDGVAHQLGGDSAFDFAWLVTAVFHDVGYIIEADQAGPGSDLWARVERGYAEKMRTPFHTTGWLDNLTEPGEIAMREELRIPETRLGYQTGSLASDRLFQSFFQEAEFAGLRALTSQKNAIKSYYDYAQKVASGRPPYRDHGVASALMLVRHWDNYDAYIKDWVTRLGERDTLPDLDVGRLQKLQALRHQRFTLIQRAAGAMSIHNVAPSQWKPVVQDAMSAGLDFSRFKISIGKDTARPNGLAFLLGLVDTLQDWDRPTFGDAPKQNALQGEDLSIRMDDGRIKVFVAGDHEEFRVPARSKRSRYGTMLEVLTSYLDRMDVESVIGWDDEFASASAEPRFPQTFTTLLRTLQSMNPPLPDEEAARLIEHLMSSLSDSPIVDGAVQVANSCLPSCYSIQALDVLGPEAWVSPVAFRYLATQLRYYARANIVERAWSLKVSAQLGAAMNRAIANAKHRGLEQSATLFDNPEDFEWRVSDDRPHLEYARILLWTQDELLSPMATIVIDTHKTFHVPLFFLNVPRDAKERRLDFICFRCLNSFGKTAVETTQGCVNERDTAGRFRLSYLTDGMIRGTPVVNIFNSLLKRQDIMFAADAKVLVGSNR